MRNLYRFILKYQFFFLFLFLEAVAIMLVFQHQQYQRTFYLHSANAISGRLLHMSNGVTSFLLLRQANRQLVEENTLLLNRQMENFMITDQQQFVARDSLYQARYTYQHARVINNSVTRRNNYMTLNKGSRHGIAPDMGVLLTNGVAGIVKDVTKNFSSVMSLLHSDMQLSVMLKRNGHIGSLRWEGRDYRLASVEYIPAHASLHLGDTIVTSGYSTIFPPGIFIGTLTDWEVRRGETFITATVELALDFNKLSYVYLVNNLMKEEQDGLELPLHSN